MNALREALGPLAARMVREHQILHVGATLESADAQAAMTIARREILLWAQRRNGSRFNQEAMAGENFEILAAGRNSAAVRLRLPNIDAWAIRQEDPDKTVPGRTWTTEAVVWQAQNQTAQFATRLFASSNEAEVNITIAVPGFMQQLTEMLTVVSGRTQLGASAWYVKTTDEQDQIIDLLTDPARRLPLILLSVPDGNPPRTSIDADSLAKSLCGLALVAAILPETSWELTSRFGKRLSVFDGAVRLFWPGFNDEADPFAHPLWLAERFHIPADADDADKRLRELAARHGLRTVRMGEHILPFSQIRSLSLKAAQAQLQQSGASDKDRLAAAEARIRSLELEVAEAQAIEKMATEYSEKSEMRAVEAERHSKGAIARVQQLLEQLKSKDLIPDQTTALPSAWDEFADWCDTSLVGRLVLTPLAQRGCKKALYTNVAQAARCMIWLANDCRTRFMEGGGSVRDEVLEEGIRNAPCGGDAFFFN